jgi:hypothetical protein
VGSRGKTLKPIYLRYIVVFIPTYLLSLTILGGSFLPVKAQKVTANKPSSNLFNAIAQTIRKDFADSDWDEIKKDITFQYAEIDLNKDGTK